MRHPVTVWQRLQGWHQLSDADLADVLGITTRTLQRRKQGQPFKKTERIVLAQLFDVDAELLDMDADQVAMTVEPARNNRPVVIHHNRHCDRVTRRPVMLTAA